jgi:GT2 family glycosyltransferase/glycosyltransferase involved in cell wall biosynthesis
MVEIRPAARPDSVAPVTVVIPIYDHWSSLERCINSVIEHVDTSIHKVILVNDCGPHADTIEGLVLLAIEGQQNFEYYRNDANKGFVGTCNRAVLELDTSGNDIMLLNSDAELTAGALEELSEVLYSAEHHAVVCPRSNNATIATLPYFRRPGMELLEPSDERDMEVFEEIAPLLPRYYISPVSIGFCYLIRRSVIDNYGLFDPAFGLGYNEENDFCLRVNAVGYSSLIANHAFVRHLGSASFSSEVKAELDGKNHQLLMSRYPFYIDAVTTFIADSYASSDVFADVITAKPEGPRAILIDIHHLSLVYNGSTRYALSFLRTLASTPLPEGVTVTVAAQGEAIAFFGLDELPFTVLRYQEVVGIYDVGIALAPVNHIDQLVQLNKHAARWLVSHFDMIASRSWALMLTDPLRPVVVEEGLKYADRVVAISEFSLKDALTFYPKMAKSLAERAEPVLLGSTRGAVTGETNDDRLVEVPLRVDVASLVSSGGYLLIMGNFYPHKQVQKAVTALADLGIPVVAFGPLPDVVETATTVVIAGGTLSESQLQEVFENAALVVFPSAYEGFGLPIADAMDFGVPVVAFDTVVAREVVAGLEATDAVRFFSRFADLPAAVTDALADTGMQTAAGAMRGTVRGLTPYNQRLWAIALELLATPLDTTALSERFETINTLQRLLRVTGRNASGGQGAELAAARARSEELLASYSYRAGNRIVRVAAPIIRLVRRPIGS